VNDALEVPLSEAGDRADVWLSRQLEAVSRATVQDWIENRHILLQDRPFVKNYRVQAGDRFQVHPPPVASAEPVTSTPIPLNILYEDEAMVVIDKDPGAVVHPGAGTEPGTTMVEALCARFGRPETGPGADAHRPGVVHRLDRETSGLLVWARTPAAWDVLSAAFKERTVVKQYLAVVQREIRSQVGVIDKPIGRHPVSRTKMAVVDNGKPAQTSWALVERGPGWSVLLCRIHTGRTHQIRVHLASEGYPLVGDKLYGFQSGQWQGGPQPPRILLHAWKLELPHPLSKRILRFQAPIPGDLEPFLPKDNGCWSQ